jgi:hypothetical protein
MQLPWIEIQLVHIDERENLLHVNRSLLQDDFSIHGV